MSTKAKTTKKPNGNGTLTLSSEAKSITVKNAGPIKEFTMAMKEGPGFYRIRGENGQGKSFFQRAWLKATGHDVDVALRDGAKELTVDFNGENLLSLKKVKNTGDVEGEIWSDCPLADFILPDAADPAVNERRRIEALLRLIDQDVTEKTIRTLLGGISADSDNEDLNEMIEECIDNAVDYVLEQEGDTIFDQNIVVAKERVRRRVHEMKRRMESMGEAAQGEITARTAAKPENPVDAAPELAQQWYDDAVRKVERLSGESSQRESQIKRQDEIRATIGERPDVERAREEERTTAIARDKMAGEIREVEKHLALMKAEFGHLEEAAQDAALDAKQTEQDAASWDQRKALLDAPVTGATANDVELAQRNVVQARKQLEDARATHAWKESCRLIREAQETREKAFARASIYERIATGATGQLAVLLAEAGVEGLTVDEDRLCEIQAGGQLEPVSRLSEGERARIGCKILLKNQTVPYNVLVLPGRLVRSLGPKAYAEVEEELIKAGLYAIYEEPGVGDVLSAEKAVQEVAAV